MVGHQWNWELTISHLEKKIRDMQQKEKENEMFISILLHDANHDAKTIKELNKFLMELQAIILNKDEAIQSQKVIINDLRDKVRMMQAKADAFDTIKQIYYPGDKDVPPLT